MIKFLCMGERNCDVSYFVDQTSPNSIKPKQAYYQSSSVAYLKCKYMYREQIVSAAVEYLMKMPQLVVKACRTAAGIGVAGIIATN